MEHDFLDGIDDAFQRLMKQNGNGKRNGTGESQSKEDRLLVEIVDHLRKLSKPQQQEVLTFVRSMEKPKVE